MHRSFYRRFASAFLLAISLLAGRSDALGTGFIFQGQLLDGSMPRNGTCDFRFQLFDVPTGGSPIGDRTQILPSVPVDNGLFTVKLNGGGELGPTAFNGEDRWLEITARCPAMGAEGSFGTPFSPRQEITAVPYALFVAPPPPSATRFTDNGDDTITDHTTGLMWEKKTGAYDPVSQLNCSTATCEDPRYVNNSYEWCDEADNDSACDNDGAYDDNPPDGGVFDDFLARINGELCESSACTGLAGYTDWRIPTVHELRSILLSSCNAGGPCIDPIFEPFAGSAHWSATTHATQQNSAFVVYLPDGATDQRSKANAFYVRAVRGGL